ncbi:hypothetical protein ANN_03107 [Periplaneta americana]|uniref:Uncharacterized protein n=1 Tax=Periplaneta americana TaxID=6978 RepID=A0ABQ8U0S3_PERAM|nr:hypothetical protein ANN_03107 [Periplaneta americana]
MEFVEQLDDIELREDYFQQDAAICHTSHGSMALILSFFDDCIISRNLWPPRSPDFTSPDFFLLDYLKGRVYATHPRSFKENITREINGIDNAMFQRTARNMERRLNISNVIYFNYVCMPTKCYFENDEQDSKRTKVTRRDSKDKCNEHSESGTLQFRHDALCSEICTSFNNVYSECHQVFIYMIKVNVTTADNVREYCKGELEFNVNSTSGLVKFVNPMLTGDHPASPLMDLGPIPRRIYDKLQSPKLQARINSYFIQYTLLCYEGNGVHRCGVKALGLLRCEPPLNFNTVDVVIRCW